MTLVFWVNETPFDVFEGARTILDGLVPTTEEAPIEVTPALEEEDSDLDEAEPGTEPPLPASPPSTRR